ncbi:hypothetical protein GSI_15160 [Ganoderma sinense ZZ0214-1]|uniref:DUF6534 domain-containing protein n=1 Tax=Ganoderma sinense ZZ0214-1 TaxID=1077348 RepID=A0A2G8RLT7_9APHY|nr:hypothetical protein GSI_15160 [Ganoderma sinense ZZ0214-1]
MLTPRATFLVFLLHIILGIRLIQPPLGSHPPSSSSASVTALLAVYTAMVSFNDVVFPPVQATTAWVLFGLCFALLFYGVLLCQGHTYFRTYQKDPLDLKLTVGAILLANAVNLGLIMHSCYFYAVRGYASHDAFNHISSSLLFLFVASAAAFIITLTVKIAQEPTFQQWLNFKWLVSACFGCSVLGDLGLACILSLALHISRTGMKRTDALLNSIIINAFRTGFVTSMLSILCLLVAVFEGKNVVIIPLSLAVAKIYANATLVTLNIRQGMSERLAAPGGSELLSVSFFRCATQHERSEGNRAPACSGSTLNYEV